MSPANIELVFGQTLRELRSTRGLSQEALGDTSGYHMTYISQLERGLKNPSLRTIMDLLLSLDVSAPEFFRKLEDRLRKQSRRT